MQLTDLTVEPRQPTQAEQDTLATLRGALPDRLSSFAEHYVSHLDATRAAAQVGAQGQERALLSDPRVLTYIQALCGQTRAAAADLRMGLVRMLAHMAAYDPKQAMGPAGWLPFSEWPDQLRMCVEQLEFNESGGVKRVKFTKRLDVVKLLLELTGGASGGPVLPGAAGRAGMRVVFEQERE